VLSAKIATIRGFCSLIRLAIIDALDHVFGLVLLLKAMIHKKAKRKTQ